VQVLAAGHQQALVRPELVSADHERDVLELVVGHQLELSHVQFALPRRWVRRHDHTELLGQRDDALARGVGTSCWFIVGQGIDRAHEAGKRSSCRVLGQIDGHLRQPSGARVVTREHGSVKVRRS